MPAWIRQITAIDDRQAWAVSERGVVLHTKDGGKTWVQKQLQSIYRMRSILFIDAFRGFVSGNNGALFATRDGGQNWEKLESKTDNSLTNLSFAGENGWAAGYWGTILKTEDGGRNWVRQHLPVDTPLEGVFFLNSRLGWAVGWSHTILHTEDGGQSWIQQQTPEGTASLQSIYFRDEHWGWAVGMFGVILYTENGGNIWKIQHSPSGTALKDLSFIDRVHGVIVGRNAILLSDDGGRSWSRRTFGSPISIDALAIGGKRLWVCGVGFIASSIDAGENWSVQRVETAGNKLTFSLNKSFEGNDP